jgi:ribonuclease P protein subunit RPR2
MVRLARERIGRLLSLARERAMVKDDAYARRYVALARRLGTRYNVRIPSDLKRWLCKKCSSFLVPGLNARVRTKGKVVITCLTCGRVSRYRIRKHKVRDGKSADARGRPQEDAAHEVSAVDVDTEAEEEDEGPD